MSDLERVPVTFLTGFLGAGKTTTLNRLLVEEHGQRLAVIVNEFGDAGVDAQLVVGGTEEVVELANGCVCCTVRGDLVRTLRDLKRRRERRFRAAKFDRVVIEASGLASPGPAVQTLLIDEELAQTFRVDGVVCCAAAPAIERQLDEYPEAAEQLGYADLVLLTHLDRVPESARAALEQRLQGAAPGARLLPSERGAGAAQALAGLQADPEDLAARVQRWQHDHSHAAGAEDQPGGQSDHEHHTPGVQALSLTAEVPLERAAFEMWLRFVAQRRGQELMRVKGLVAVEGGASSLVVHGIYQWLELVPGAARQDSLLVLIGRDLDLAELRRGWQTVGGS